MKEETFVHYRLNHTRLDTEHLDMFVQNDIVIDNLRKSENDLAMVNIEKLISSVKLHFAEEEKLMTAANYPFLQGHIDAHWEVLCLLTDIYAVDIPAKSFVQNIKICRILDNLLVDHVDYYDRQFSERKD